MAASFVAERAKAHGSGSPTQAVAGTTVGNLLVIGFAITATSSGTASLTGVTDTGSNTWAVVGGAPATTIRPGSFLAYTFLTGAPGTITMTVSGTPSAGVGWKIEEFSGLGAFDVAATGVTGAAATSGSTNAATPAGSGELAVAFFATNGAQTSFTLGGSYVLAGTSQNTSPDTGFEYLLSAGSGSQSASMSWASSSTFAASLAFFTVTAAATAHLLAACGAGR